MADTYAPPTDPERSIRTHAVGEGDDAVTYDIHGDLTDATPERPVLLMFASPMEAAAFGPLASHFADRPVVTYDPRGAGRNPVGTSELTPEQHAEDLHRVISALGAGPVDVFGSSGGAINALALATTYPDDVRRVVAHEPPLVAGLPDREDVLAALRDMKHTYGASGNGPAMAKFINLVMTDGPLPDDYLDQPAPDPATFGRSAEDDGTRTDPLFRNMPVCNEYRVDAGKLGRLGERPVTDFPSHHAGFISGEDPGYPGDPEGFAAKLREVLA